ncbi:NFKBIE, partial [Cervus elaphus hippelaphus]
GGASVRKRGACRGRGLRAGRASASDWAAQLPRVAAAVDPGGGPPAAWEGGHFGSRTRSARRTCNPERRRGVGSCWDRARRAGAAGMSEARKGPDETDENQYDSGIESLRSLRSLPESTPRPVSGPSDGGGPQPWIHPPGTAKEPEEKEDTDGERADSTYGSSSLTEPLSLSGDPRTEDAVSDSPLPAAGALSPQQLEALTYISEDGDTLIHLAVIHEAPAVLLYCLALLPQEVLDIQNNLYQTALHLAVHLDQPGAVRALVLKGASRVLQDRHGDTALHVACQRQHLACARCLLEGQPEPGRGPPHSLDLQLQNWQ